MLWLLALPRKAYNAVKATVANIFSAFAIAQSNIRSTRPVRFGRYITTALVVSAMSGSAFAQSAAIEIDTDTFINAINQWLPLALTITAIGVGIAGGFKLAMFIGRMLINAFDGRL